MVLNILLLVSALCLDTFVASAAYGTNRVRISHRQIAFFNAFCSLSLGLSLLFGTFLDSQIPEPLTKRLCFYSLLFLGVLRLFDSMIRQYLKNHAAIEKNASFQFSHLRLIVSIYVDPMEADTNQDQSLSWKEVLFFSAAMSADSLFTGMMAAFLKISVPLTVAASFLVGELFTYLGLWLGRRISSRSPKDLSWAGGLLLILLAVLKSR